MNQRFDVIEVPTAGGRLGVPQRCDTELFSGQASVVAPIRSLGANHRSRISRHLLALDGPDRYLRFGYQAHDAQIRAYVDGLDFDRDEIFGIYNWRLELIAVAHLAPDRAREGLSCAEFGVSVLPAGRRRGYGCRLFERAAMHASNAGIRLLRIHALSENTGMLSIARKMGATVVRHGPESEACLCLPEPTADSRLAEVRQELIARTDYLLKLQQRQDGRIRQPGPPM